MKKYVRVLALIFAVMLLGEGSFALAQSELLTGADKPALYPEARITEDTGKLTGSGLLGDERGGRGKPTRGTLATETTKRVAITFDDGPHAEYTPAILDALAEYGAKATFFVMGNKAKKNTDILARMVREGHEIGNHTYDHTKLTTLSYEKALRQLERTNDIIFAACAVTPVLARPPYGSKNKTTLRCMKELGLACVIWSVDPQDYNKSKPQTVCDCVVDNVCDGSIILLHDRKKVTVEATRLILEALSAQGYTFVTVSELYNGDMTAGASYGGAQK